MYEYEGEYSDGEDSIVVDNEIKAMINKIDEKVLKDWAIQVCTTSEDAFESLQRMHDLKVNGKTVDDYKRAIRLIFKRYADNDSVNYRKVNDLFNDLSKFINFEFQYFIKNDAINSVHLINFIMEYMNKFYIDDLYGYIVDFHKLLLNNVENIINKANSQEEERIFEIYYNFNKPVNECSIEYIDMIIFNNFKDSKFLEQKLIYARKELNKIEKYTPYNEHWLKRYIEILILLDVDKVVISRLIEAYQDTYSVLKFKIEQAITDRDLEEGDKILAQLKSDIEIINKRKLLKQLFVQYKEYDIDKYKSLLYDYLMEENPSDFNKYVELRRLCDQEV